MSAEHTPIVDELLLALQRAETALDMFVNSDAFVPALTDKRPNDDSDLDAERRQMIWRVATESLEQVRAAIAKATGE